MKASRGKAHVHKLTEARSLQSTLGQWVREKKIKWSTVRNRFVGFIFVCIFHRTCLLYKWSCRRAMRCNATTSILFNCSTELKLQSNTVHLFSRFYSLFTKCISCKMKKIIIIRLMASAASVWMGFASLKSDMRINSNRMELLFSLEKILFLCIRQMLINSSDT